MAKNLKLQPNGPGHNSSLSEKPFFDRLVAIEKSMEALREDRKQVSIEARQVDIRITHLKHSVKLYLESEEKRSAREEKEAEAERILRSIGELGDTPLGKAAVLSALA